MVQLRTRNIEVERIKETVKQIDALNLSLDQKVDYLNALNYLIKKMFFIFNVDVIARYS